MKRLRKAFEQLSFLVYELNRIVNGHYWRWFTLWFGGSTGIVISYRIDRLFFLLLGRIWPAVRIAFLPFFLLLRLLSYPHEIHYRADIGKGMKILHGSLGVVVSGTACIGKHLILTGGNCIGGREPNAAAILGDYVELGVNAVVLGPVRLGNHVQVGAGAVVIHDAEDYSILVGIPATRRKMDWAPADHQ